MKSAAFLIITFIFISTNLFSQKKIELYISSRDCVKCFAGMYNVVHIFEENPGMSGMLSIITDSRSSKAKILKDYSFLSHENIRLDKDIVDKMVPDGKSICITREGNTIIENTSLSVLDKDKIRNLKFWLQEIDPLYTKVIQDSIFEPGLFQSSVESGKIVLFHKLLQKYLIIQLAEDSATYFTNDISIDPNEYNSIGKAIEDSEGFKTLDYDSALIWNRVTRLPMISTASAFVDGHNLYSFKSIYYYTVENKDNIGNRGFVYLESAEIKADTIELVKRSPIKTFEADGKMVYYHIFTPHQKTSPNTFFSYCNTLEDDGNKEKIENNYFGCLYSTVDKDISIVKDFKFKELTMPDSLQQELKKYSFGNNPKYFSFKNNDYILYRNLLLIFDLGSGTSFTVQDFINEVFDLNFSLDARYIFDFIFFENGFSLLYYDLQKKSNLLLTNSYKGNISTLKLDHSDRIDYLKLDFEKITLLYKNEDANALEIKIYKNPFSETQSQ